MINKLRNKWNSKIYVISISFLLFISCKFVSDPLQTEPELKELPSISVDWDSTHSIVCFGTSLTYGLIWEGLDPVYLQKTNYYSLIKNNDLNSSFFYTRADSAYPKCLDNRLKIKVYNQGYPGATVNSAISYLADSVLTKNPSLVLLEFSANDFLRKRDVSTTREEMIELIDSISNFGSKIVLISFVDEYTINHPPKDHLLYDQRELAKEYYLMLKDIANEYNLLFINDCFLGIFGHTDLMCDDIHPNNEGYIKMAENIYKSLYKTFKINNMLK
ncbi:MAG: hypothetical protein JXR46_06230 [Calditrichaceae bacterium]|nr:hypothetical protein [Calditrichaceae bacterium]MBN2708624.1 hypothetical protein [Calditrichaceae bacterium]